jgi:hypothetical protein
MDFEDKEKQETSMPKKVEKKKQSDPFRLMEEIIKKIKKHWRRPSKKALEIFYLQDPWEQSQLKRKPSISLKNTQLLADIK